MSCWWLPACMRCSVVGSLLGCTGVNQTATCHGATKACQVCIHMSTCKAFMVVMCHVLIKQCSWLPQECSVVTNLDDNAAVSVTDRAALTQPRLTATISQSNATEQTRPFRFAADTEGAPSRCHREQENSLLVRLGRCWCASCWPPRRSSCASC